MTFLKKTAKKFGYEFNKIKSEEEQFPDFENDFFKLAKKCLPFTMTSYERLYAVYKSTEYILKNNIEGDFVECGVWKGGSSMMAALTLLKNNIRNKRFSTS